MVIKQPPDINVTVPNGSFVFRWNPRFGAVMTDRLQKTQRYIDSESIRLMVPSNAYSVPPSFTRSSFSGASI